MSEALEKRAEIVKLARLLDREPSTLGYLESVPSQDIRALRERVTDMLFTAHGGTLGRLAAASKVLPVGLVAMLGERVFGPVLSARVAGLLEPGRAVEMAARLPTPFLADVAVELDPRRASDVIARIPAQRVGEITRELLAREEYVTMGRFVGHLSDEAISAAIGVMDDRQLLQVAFVLEEKSSLDRLVDLLPEERVDTVGDAAAAWNLWPEALDLLSHLSDQRRGALADRAAGREDAVLDSLVAAAQQERIWDAVLPVARSMSEASRQRFATLRSIQAEGALEEIVRVAAEQALWAELIPIARFLPADAQRRVAIAAGSLELDQVATERLAAAVIEHDLWDEVLEIAERMPGGELNLLAERIIAVDSKAETMIPALLAAADRTERWEQALNLLAQLGGPVQQQLAERFTQLEPEQRQLIAQQARAAGMLDRLGPLGEMLG